MSLSNPKRKLQIVLGSVLVLTVVVGGGLLLPGLAEAAQTAGPCYLYKCTDTYLDCCTGNRMWTERRCEYRDAGGVCFYTYKWFCNYDLHC